MAFTFFTMDEVDRFASTATRAAIEPPRSDDGVWCYDGIDSGEKESKALWDASASKDARA